MSSMLRDQTLVRRIWWVSGATLVIVPRVCRWVARQERSTSRASRALELGVPVTKFTAQSGYEFYVTVRLETAATW